MGGDSGLGVLENGSGLVAGFAVFAEAYFLFEPLEVHYRVF